MSINLFADRKMAIGFAGVIVGLAGIAGLSMGAFAPREDGPAEPARGNVTIVEAPEGAPAALPVAAWTDDGSPDDGSSDDWASGDTDDGLVDSSSGDSNVSDEAPMRAFGEYSPREARASATPSNEANIQTIEGVTIWSGAGPNAPQIRPPGQSAPQLGPAITG